MNYEIEHKELHNKIWDCKKCCPIGIKDKYCKNCKKAVLDFMDRYGVGVLTNFYIKVEKFDGVKNERKEFKI